MAVVKVRIAATNVAELVQRAADLVIDLGNGHIEPATGVGERLTQEPLEEPGQGWMDCVVAATQRPE